MAEVKICSYLLALTLGFTTTTACAQQTYIPVLLNLSTLLDFNPVKGPVKTIDSVGTDDKGNEVYTLHMVLSAEGCVQTLRRDDKSNISHMNLAKEEKSLKGTFNGQPVAYGLDDRCNLTSRDDSDGHLDYKTNAQGLLGETMLRTLKITDHFYDTDGNIKKVQYYSGDLVASSTSIRYPDSVNKPLDYTMVNESALDARFNFTAVSECQYDERQVPVLCHVKVTPANSGNALTHMTVATRASFY
ncbi:YnfC family lipoprotein [Kosakonia sp. R1.Fl]|uniref:YnfC family lipoprotein n=1 Tax=Kosakonia sp. R1.Fl TaxID=2928706 RepID=UPI00201E09DB|nr:YnfC family lipoprotein [Kosakonia sp. R1.Fl]MCL6746268.1 YnfC family lipoprotein [Kosakonia sp. R1.Fl]